MRAERPTRSVFYYIQTDTLFLRCQCAGVSCGIYGENGSINAAPFEHFLKGVSVAADAAAKGRLVDKKSLPVYIDDRISLDRSNYTVLTLKALTMTSDEDCLR